MGKLEIFAEDKKMGYIVYNIFLGKDMGEVVPFPAQNKSLSGKGILYDAAVEMEQLAPEIQYEIDARESMIEKIFGVNPKDFFYFDAAERIEIFDRRRHPEDFDTGKGLNEQLGKQAA